MDKSYNPSRTAMLSPIIITLFALIVLVGARLYLTSTYNPNIRSSTEILTEIQNKYSKQDLIISTNYIREVNFKKDSIELVALDLTLNLSDIPESEVSKLKKEYKESKENEKYYTKDDNLIFNISIGILMFMLGALIYVYTSTFRTKGNNNE